MDSGKTPQDRANIMAAVQIIFGIVIFTSAWWLPEGSRQTGFYVFGFVTVLLGIVTAVMLTTRN
ncbi:MAG: hypothetical protein ACYCXF_03555 [Thermoleophilia bacterium]